MTELPTAAIESMRAIIVELAAEPIAATTDMHGDPYCPLCGKESLNGTDLYRGHPAAHEDDCLWLRARAVADVLNHWDAQQLMYPGTDEPVAVHDAVDLAGSQYVVAEMHREQGRDGTKWAITLTNSQGTWRMVPTEEGFAQLRKVKS